jgi:hypothetical protein
MRHLIKEQNGLRMKLILMGATMKTKRTAAAVERLESLAANALEDLIEDTEGSAHVKVKEVEVALIPDVHGASPAVFVTVTVKKP